MTSKVKLNPSVRRDTSLLVKLIKKALVAVVRHKAPVLWISFCVRLNLDLRSKHSVACLFVIAHKLAICGEEPEISNSRFFPSSFDTCQI